MLAKQLTVKSNLYENCIKGNIKLWNGGWITGRVLESYNSVVTLFKKEIDLSRKVLSKILERGTGKFLL